MQSELDQLIPTLLVVPFPKTYKKLLKSSKYSNLICPKCGFSDDIFRRNTGFPLHYCKGNLPAEVEHEIVDFTGNKTSHKHQVNCAHIHFEHFHTQCQICDFIFVLSMPEAR